MERDCVTLCVGRTLGVLMTLVSAPICFAAEPTPQGLRFEVATVKPDNSGPGNRETHSTSTRIDITNYTAKDLIRRAFGNLPEGRISGAPNWLDEARYDIVGQFAAGESTHTPEGFQPALQALLADRFGFKFHLEQHEFPVYELVVAKGGSKLPLGTGDGSTHSVNGQYTGTKISLSTFVNRFPGQIDRVVLDKTGLTGLYDISLTWTPDRIAISDPADSNNLPTGPSIFTALEEQLGLHLQSGKALLDVVVIDAIQKPSAN